jgi:hypothetical protein
MQEYNFEAAEQMRDYPYQLSIEMGELFADVAAQDLNEASARNWQNTQRKPCSHPAKQSSSMHKTANKFIQRRQVPVLGFCLLTLALVYAG